MNLIDKYVEYISGVRRYSPNTCRIYADSLAMFWKFLDEEPSQEKFLSNIKPLTIRSYEVQLLEGEKMSPRTVNLHLSVLSGFCRFLMKHGYISTNPVSVVKRPKMEKRLPHFYRAESMDEYFSRTAVYSWKQAKSPADESKEMYDRRLRRLIVLTLYTTACRRSELISLRVSSIDFGRKNARILGKGNKMREIPLTDELCEEISLYLQAVAATKGVAVEKNAPLFATFGGRALYPSYVDRAVKEELGQISTITGKKSPHVLRHTLATELLNEGSDLNSIKEMLGHSSLAATQVYTHNSVAKLKKVYESAHPRAIKNGGKNGD